MRLDSASVSTRRFARNLVQDAAERDGVLNLEEVTFISRCAADQLLYSAYEHDVRLTNVREEPKKMLDVIEISEDKEQPQITYIN